MRKYTKYKQGKFKPRNPQKYKGTFPIVYRSSLELKAFRYLDNNNSIKFWNSESIVVPYLDPTRPRNGRPTMHRYFVDLGFIVEDKNGNIKKYMCEIKPSTQTHPPKRGRKQEKTFIKECVDWERNNAKWKSAKKFAKSKGAKFIIITEKELKDRD